MAPGFREFFDHRIGGTVPVLALAFAISAALGIWVQRATRFGRMLYLIGSNAAAAGLAGLPAAGVIVAAYVISGSCGALGGIALLARSGVSSTFAGRGLEVGSA